VIDTLQDIYLVTDRIRNNVPRIYARDLR
jgi:hypothetical protein